jgi:hypothetical protein
MTENSNIKAQINKLQEEVIKSVESPSDFNNLFKL